MKTNERYVYNSSSENTGHTILYRCVAGCIETTRRGAKISLWFTVRDRTNATQRSPAHFDCPKCGKSGVLA